MGKASLGLCCSSEVEDKLLDGPGEQRGAFKSCLFPFPALREKKGAKRSRGGKAPLLPLEEQDIYTAAEAVLLLIVFTRG